MISLLNFGDSPFYLLFVIVVVVFGAVLVANLLAGIAILFLNWRIRSLARRQKGQA